MWNLNFIRTIIGLAAGGGVSGVIYLLFQLAGCTVDDPGTTVNEITTCANSKIIPAQYTGVATLIAVMIGGILKTMKGGTVTENLTAPSVPVVEKAAARPGVVTKAQVASGRGR